jgi:alcohol dehydrogenase class IV
MPSYWSFPTRIVFGSGSVATVPAEARRIGLERVLLVSDEGVRKTGVLDKVKASLEQDGLGVAVFTGLSSNPVESEVTAGVKAYRDGRAQGCIALGGGAPMDVAKLIVVRATTDRSWAELDDAKGGDALVPAVLPPVITIPTTAGTGSEVGRAAVVTIDATHAKTVIFSPSMLPKAAILDPDLTLSLPPKPTAATGFDALTHCFEAWMSKGDHPLADSVALGGLELIAGSLETAVKNGSDVAARGAMLKAAMMGAVSFQKGLGACHSLSHPLSAELDLHHGLANALCLPAVVDFNEQVIPERVQRVAAIFGRKRERGAAAQALRDLRKAVGLPGSLREAGVPESELPRLAKLALADGCHGSNPRPCSEQDMLALYKASY